MCNAQQHRMTTLLTCDPLDPICCIRAASRNLSGDAYSRGTPGKPGSCAAAANMDGMDVCGWLGIGRCMCMPGSVFSCCGLAVAAKAELYASASELSDRLSSTCSGGCTVSNHLCVREQQQSHNRMHGMQA